MQKMMKWNSERLDYAVLVHGKDSMNDSMKYSQNNEEEEEEEEVVKEDMKEEQRPCYSRHTVARPQNQARPPVPMVTSPLPARCRAGIG